MQNLHLLSTEVNLKVKPLFTIVDDAYAYTPDYCVYVGGGVAPERHVESKWLIRVVNHLVKVWAPVYRLNSVFHIS